MKALGCRLQPPVEPYSISMALAMTYAGARTQTETEIEETLHFSLGRQRLHPAPCASRIPRGVVRVNCGSFWFNFEAGLSLVDATAWRDPTPFVSLGVGLWPRT